MKIVCTLLILVGLAASARAASLSDYKSRIDTARVSVNNLFEKLDTDAVDIGAERIAKLIPARERVEWPGGSIETQNEWLGYSVESLEGAATAEEKAVVLTTISERLSAISENIAELERVAATGPSKDENKQKLAEILIREEYQKAQKAEPSLFQKWLDAFLTWLAKVFPGSPVAPSNVTPGVGSIQFWLQILIYAVVIALVGFLVYRFGPRLMRRMKRDDVEDRIILGERVAADESAFDLFAEAERLARDGNLRAAIRKGYIALLCDLSDRKHLRLARHKTNRDYLRDVRKNAGLHENMTAVTRKFEMSWYGLRPAGEADWEEFRNGYRQSVEAARR